MATSPSFSPPQQISNQHESLPPALASPACITFNMRLIHLLFAAAEAVAKHHHDLALIILQRIDQLSSTRTTTMERLAFYYSCAMRCRIEGFIRNLFPVDQLPTSPTNLASLQVLHEWTPFIKFSHFTANQAILEATEGRRRLHIVDYDIGDGSQWSSFMCSFVSSHGGSHLLHMTITAIYWSRGLADVWDVGRRLSEFAASIDLSFTFKKVAVHSEEEELIHVSAIQLAKYDTVVANCMIHLPHLRNRSTCSVETFLQTVRQLDPKVVTVVEEVLGCSSNAPFIDWFLHSLLHYSTLFDSLEGSLSSVDHDFTRTLVEQTFFAPNITSTLAMTSNCLHPTVNAADGSESTEKIRPWRCIVRSAGFKMVPISAKNQCQAKLLLGLYPQDFNAIMEGDRLLLGWHSRALFAASVWQCEEYEGFLLEASV